MMINKKIISVCTAFVFGASIFSVSMTNVSADNTMPVTVYADPAFGGVSQDFTLGDHNVTELVAQGGVGNDMISGIRVSPGYKVTLFQDAGFSGSTAVFTANNPWIDFDDKTSSIRVELAAPHAPVTVYKDINMGGSSQEFDVGDHGYSELTGTGGIGNDAVSSLRVAPGYKVTLYQNSGFGGMTSVITDDVFSLGDFNDRTSSLKVEAISPVDSTCIQVDAFNDAAKASLLSTFAPRIWMAGGETSWACSVEWALPNLQRYFSTNANRYCYQTVEPLSDPTAKLPYFSGNQASARAYSFWTEKDYNNIDLSYWQFTPYDTGKVVTGSQFGAHVSDWEHITVRLAKFTYNGVNYVKPVAVAYPYHSWINYYKWNEVEKVSGTNHPIAYSAKGSHGMWKDPGNHVYKDIVVAQLTDECSAGTAMDCWNIMNAFEYFPGTLSGRGIGTTVWPSYFNCDYQDPNGSGAYRWGNDSQGSLFGQPILADGASGPERHDTLYDWIALK